MTEAPLWTAGSGAPRALEAVPEDVDVAIVGAGFTGLSAALALRARNVSVAVVEAERAGAGASSRNGGMALAGLKLEASALRAKYGPEKARQYFDASLRAIDLVETLIERHGIDCAFARTGHLELAAKPSHARAFEAAAAQLRGDFGHVVRALDREELRDEIGSNAYFGGLLDTASAGLDPARYCAGLARAASAAGAAICEETRVSAVLRDGDRFNVDSARGTLRAGNVVVATGAYTGCEFPWLRRRIVPVGSYAIATAPLDRNVAASILPHGRMAFDSNRLLHYFRLTPEGRLLFGGRAAFVPERPDTVRRSKEILVREMEAIFPQLRGVVVDYAWGGRIDVAFDVMPHAGRYDGVYYAAGFAGHGVALATLAGTLLGEAIATGAPLAPLDAFPPAVPWYRGTPWFLPLAGVWQRLLDRIA